MRKKFILLALLLTAIPCWAQIALDTSSTGTSGTATSITFSYTNNGNILFVGTADQIASSSLITGVTYATVAMTEIGTGAQAPSDRYTRLWFLVGPATGANNVVVSASSSTFLEAKAASYTGALQTGVPDATNKATGTSTSASVSVTSVAANCWTVTWVKAQNGIVTGGTNVTLRQNGSQALIGDSNAALAAGAHTTTAAISVSGGWAIISASFAPATGVTPTGMNKREKLELLDP
jgi:hypothetical protein